MAEVRLLTAGLEGELRSLLVSTARSFVGVDYRHRGRTRDGLDCSGLVIATVRESGCTASPPAPTYGLIPEADLLDRMLAEHMVRLNDWREARPGDVITRCFRLGQPAKHCGVVTLNDPDNLRCVHASRTARRVVEGRWPDPLFNCYAYRVREVAALLP